VISEAVIGEALQQGLASLGILEMLHEPTSDFSIDANQVKSEYCPILGVRGRSRCGKFQEWLNGLLTMGSDGVHIIGIAKPVSFAGFNFLPFSIEVFDELRQWNLCLNGDLLSPSRDSAFVLPIPRRYVKHTLGGELAARKHQECESDEGSHGLDTEYPEWADKHRGHRGSLTLAGIGDFKAIKP
jgi:hypothetical protein